MDFLLVKQHCDKGRCQLRTFYESGMLQRWIAWDSEGIGFDTFKYLSLHQKSIVNQTHYFGAATVTDCLPNWQFCSLRVVVIKSFYRYNRQCFRLHWMNLSVTQSTYRQATERLWIERYEEGKSRSLMWVTNAIFVLRHWENPREPESINGCCTRD